MSHMTTTANTPNYDGDTHTIESIAHKLLTDNNVKNFENDICIFNSGDNDPDKHFIQYEFMLDLSMEVLFQFMYNVKLIKLSENGEEVDDNDLLPQKMKYDMTKVTDVFVKKLFDKVLNKVSILSFIHETDKNDKGYYCKIIFYDNCDARQKREYFEKCNSEKKFRFVSQSNFDKSSVINMSDLYSILTLNGKNYKLKFSHR